MDSVAVGGSDTAAEKRRLGQRYRLGWACGSGEPYSSSRGSRGTGGGPADTLPFDAAQQVTVGEYNPVPKPIIVSVAGNKIHGKKLGAAKLSLACCLKCKMSGCSLFKSDTVLELVPLEVVLLH